ncbi:hypothetical protein MBLNU459_g3349t1 [Dothideomycetes sp. NU459]
MTPKVGNGETAMVGIGAAFLAVTWFTVSLRVWVRTKMIKCWGWDDWTILMALAFYTAEVAVLFRMAVIEKEPLNLVTAEQFAVSIEAEQALYIAGTIFLKISLAIFFLNFVLERWQRRVVWISVILYSIHATVAVFLIVFDCGLPTDLVLKNLRHQCINFSVFETLAYIHGALNAATDWLFAILPISVLWTSITPRSTKISACLILLIAVAGSIASCVRTAYISNLAPTSLNFYEAATKPLTWTVIEPGLGITAASLATLRPLLRKCFERTKSLINTSRRLRSTLHDNNNNNNNNVGNRSPAIAMTTTITMANENPKKNRASRLSDEFDKDPIYEMKEMRDSTRPESVWTLPSPSSSSSPPPPINTYDPYSLETPTSPDELADDGDNNNNNNKAWDLESGLKPAAAHRVSVYKLST